MKTKHLCVAFILSLLAFQACTTDDVSLPKTPVRMTKAIFILLKITLSGSI